MSMGWANQKRKDRKAKRRHRGSVKTKKGRRR
jgi:hypothetical protein